MRKLVLSINISLDGYADHTIVTTATDDLHNFFSDLLDKTGVELFGRVTYQMMESYWPTAHENPEASKADLDFAKRFNEIPKIVFSSRLTEARWNNTTLIKTDAVSYVRELKKTEGKDIFVGGLSLSGSLVKAGLVDEYWVVVHPVVVGQGRRFLENVNENFELKLLQSIPLQSGALALHYASIDKAK